MCGLMAGTGKLDGKVLTALGCLNEERGTDSAGVGYLEGGIVKILKIATHPLVAFPKSLAKAIRVAMNEKPNGVLIGHTRAATTGAVTSENAHPFLDDSGIAFAHNGIISNHEKFGKFDVDSQSLIFGIKNRDFSEYEGSIALVWIENRKLHAYRKGNPLYRGVMRGATYLSSTRRHLEIVGCKKVRELGEGRVYVFDGSRCVDAKSVKTNTVRAYVRTACSTAVGAGTGRNGGRTGKWDARKGTYTWKEWDSKKRSFEWPKGKEYLETEDDYDYGNDYPFPGPSVVDASKSAEPETEPVTTALEPVKNGVAGYLREQYDKKQEWEREDMRIRMARISARRDRLKLSGPAPLSEIEAQALGSTCQGCYSEEALSGSMYCVNCAQSLPERTESRCLVCGDEPQMIGTDFGERCASAYQLHGVAQ